MAIPFAPSSLNKKKESDKIDDNISFFKNSFLIHFDNLKDPRIDRTKDHLLIDIIAISILAVISGADGWTAIETYGKAKEQWLRTFLELPNGIPSHDTISRVFQRLNPEEFAASFSSWINLIVEKLGAEVIAIDGKTLKQSYDRNSFQKALHIVTAWANNNKLVLGQKKVDSKSNEITAIPALLETLDIAGNIITIDAMGTQKAHRLRGGLLRVKTEQAEIAKLIIKKKADYILALKGNQKKLHKQVEDWFKEAKNNNFTGIEYSYHSQVEAGHHRIEKRQHGDWICPLTRGIPRRQIYSVPISLLPALHNQNKWQGLKTVIMVISERMLWNKTTKEVRFYISSMESNAKVLSQGIREHWGIENSLHWSLDITFLEDKSRIRKDNAPKNFALLRKLSLNLLNQEKTSKASNKMSRYRAAMDNEYLLKILNTPDYKSE